MFQRMLTSALFAGVAAGLIAALLHFAFVQRLILLGEQYETGEITHFTAGSSGADALVAPHSHDVADNGQIVAGQDAAEQDTQSHDAHSHGAGEEASTLKRNSLTVLFMVLIYTSYGMLLTAGFGLMASLGYQIGPKEGVLWGVAGYIAFQLAPAMGLAPELPGTIGADLGARQIWWWSTVACTATALGLLAYGRQVWTFVLAGGLLALPHVIGAPQPEAFFGVAPPELAAAFSARVLGVALIVWACLGALAGHFWSKQPIA